MKNEFIKPSNCIHPGIRNYNYNFRKALTIDINKRLKSNFEIVEINNVEINNVCKELKKNV